MLRSPRTIYAFGILLVTTVGLLGPGDMRGDSAAANRPAKFSQSSNAACSVLLGVSTPAGVADLSQLDKFEQDAAKDVGLFSYYQGFAHHPEFDRSGAERLHSRGVQPMITWEPWDYRSGTEQRDFALRRIIDGTYDDYIRRWATGIKAWGKPLMLRFGHEMNGDWYPWAEAANGNAPGDYVNAWRHIHRTFRSVGATNVEWVWSPNAVYEGSTPLAGLYPGDRYVDWVGVDGYNWGSSQPGKRWQSFDEIFAPTLAEIDAITGKPLMLGEVASSEVGGDKAAWVGDFFAELKRRPQIRAFVWFNHDKETDWRIESSEMARSAFAAGVADARYC